MPDYVERASSDYADVQALIDEGKLAEAEELAATKNLSGEDRQIVQDLLTSAREAEAATRKPKAESKPEATKKLT